MVKLEAIPDEHFTSEQLGPDNDEDYYTDTGTFPFFLSHSDHESHPFKD